MEGLRLVTEDCLCISEADRSARDQIVYEMCIDYLNDVASEVIQTPGRLVVSFFNQAYMDRFREWLHQSGWSYASGEQMGCTCVLQMAVPACPRGLFLRTLEPL